MAAGRAPSAIHSPSSRTGPCKTFWPRFHRSWPVHPNKTLQAESFSFESLVTSRSGFYIRGERLAPVTKRWQSNHRRIPRPRRMVNLACGDFVYELWIRADDAGRFASERCIRTNPAVDDLMNAEFAL